ncbi:MAG: hypothetical protein Ct9H300mP16_17700 [Pseudomonadota bacterium]|nr:MAG: hypothetical protein Ct9H300mP16_17700 [Pseudomonadota bacterium]
MTRNSAWLALARPAAFAQFGLVLIAYGCLTAAFLGNDFSVAYVAQNSNFPKSRCCTGSPGSGGTRGFIAAVGVDSVPLDHCRRALQPQCARDMTARVLGIMGPISIGFPFCSFCSRPARLNASFRFPWRTRPQPAAAGPRSCHPPADALPGVCRLLRELRLCHRCTDERSTRYRLGPWSRPWTAMAWSFLTVGIALGVGGPTTNWDGVAGGSGILLRTPRLCPGWSARLSFTLSRPPRNAGSSGRGRSCWPFSHSHCRSGNVSGPLRRSDFGACFCI